MSCRQSRGLHFSNVKNSQNEVDFDFFDCKITNNENNFKEHSFGLNNDCRPNQFLTEVIIETNRDVDALVPKEVTVVEDKTVPDLNTLRNSDENINIPEIHSNNLDLSLVNCIAYENEEFEDEEDSFDSLSESSNTSDLTNVTPISSSNGSLNMLKQTIPIDQTERQDFIDKTETEEITEKRLESSSEEKELLSLVKSLETLSIPDSSACSRVTSSNSIKSKPKRKSMTFTNEQLRKINRDNDILLKKIMSHAKPRPKQMSTVHNFHPTRTSAAINRAKQQKQIEHDNYILLNKIRGVKQTRKSIFGAG